MDHIVYGEVVSYVTIAVILGPWPSVPQSISASTTALIRIPFCDFFPLWGLHTSSLRNEEREEGNERE